MIFQLVLNLENKEKAMKMMKDLDAQIKACSGKVVGLETKSLVVEKNGVSKQINLMGLLIDIPKDHSKHFMAYLKGNKISNKVHKPKSSTKKTVKKTIKKSKTPTKKTMKKSVKKVTKTVKKSKTPTKKTSLKSKAKKDMKKLVKNVKKVEKNMKKLEKKTKSKK